MALGRCYDLTETPPYGPWREALAAIPVTSDVPLLPQALAGDGVGAAVASQEALFAQAHEAQGHLDRALALAEACAAPYVWALTLLAQAELRAATGDRDDAQALLGEVRAICEPLGAKAALVRADALAAQLDEGGP